MPIKRAVSKYTGHNAHLEMYVVEHDSGVVDIVAEVRLDQRTDGCWHMRSFYPSIADLKALIAEAESMGGERHE